MSRLVQQIGSGLPPAGASKVGATSWGAAADERRLRIVLACAGCGGRNYRKTKARREGVSPLSLSKFCSICNAHTQHREAV